MTSERKRALEQSTLAGEATAAGTAGPTAMPALTILYHPDLDRVGQRALLADLAAGGAALVSRAEPDFAPPGEAQGEPLGEQHLSRKPIRLVRAGDGVRLEIAGSSTAVAAHGARVQGSARFSAAQIQRGVVLELGHRVVLLLHLVTSLQALLAGADAPGDPRDLAGESDGLRQVLLEIRSVADLDLPVLLRGESGSGKELVASAIHRQGPRRDRPFVAVNLGAIPPTLAISELFGAERGAHSTAARRQPGYIEQARGGTLFLDEIGEAPIELQVALLRFLETGEVQAVGAQVRKADVRVVAATDADLEAKVAAGTFRAPLLNRLSAYEIAIPPLRARRDDIGRLLARFLREELDRVGEAHRLLAPEPDAKPWLPAALVARLADHDWPGNIRQLRNVVRQLVIGSRGRERLELTPAVERLLGAGPPHAATQSDAPTQARDTPPSPPAPDQAAPAAPDSDPTDLSPTDPSAKAPGAARRAPSDVTEEELAEALRATGGNVTKTARQLNISRPSLYMLLERYPRVQRPPR
ncbi:sigma 54-interacting transcriptional regulator [Sorangium sp. So ce542]|uniref:sigma 54-interacting transcriptional regulator n=1 Tax=Sorangium sp. So ce542 TaxID=3133316 RepID=UPI003F601C18